MTIPWSSHQTLIIKEPGPWIVKPVFSRTFAYCPNCQDYPQTNLRDQETGEVGCGCHKTTATITECIPAALQK